MQSYEILKPIIKKIKDWSEKHGYDRYIKNHFLDKMFIFLLFQHTSNEAYGRTLTVRLKNLCTNENGNIPSQGELSKKLAYKLPLDVWINTYKDMVQKSLMVKNKKIKRLAKRLKIIDSSTFQASLSMIWAKHRKTANGFKIHMMINSNLVPEEFRMKNGSSSDKKSLKWAVKRGFLYVFDRGYNDYKQFKWISERKAYFVTRALSNIKYSLIKNNHISKNQKKGGIIFDKIIEVITDRKSGQTDQFRLVRFGFTDTTGKDRIFDFITNVFDMAADEIADIYKQRWLIETFFKWIKMSLELSHWISRSQRGVKIQLYSALILYLIVKLSQTSDPAPMKILKDYNHIFNAVFLNMLLHYRSYSGIHDFLKNSFKE